MAAKSVCMIVGRSFANRDIISSSVRSLTEREAATRLKYLDREIRRHDELYYDASRPTVSDATYDSLIAEAKDLEVHYPILKGTVEKLCTVGYAPSGAFDQFEHAEPMLSLQNLFTAGDVASFVSRINAKTKEGPSSSAEFVLEPKIDGVSLSLLYRYGKLVRAGTRGDGKIGEDVTRNVLLNVEDIPHALHAAESLRFSTLEVRGEVFMTKSMLAMCNDAAGGPNEFSTARNAASGILRRKHTPAVSSDKKKLNFYAYSMLCQEDHVCEQAHITPARTQEEVLSSLQELGFHVASWSDSGSTSEGHTLCTPPRYTSAESIYEACTLFEARRHLCPYDVDGAVIKLNCLQDRNVVGTTSRYPRWAAAFKFSSDQKVTKIRSIEVQVGTKGALTPIAILDPVNIGGVVVKRATLHNEDNVNRIFGELITSDMDSCHLDIDVVVCRSGDVIPKILGTVDGLGRQTGQDGQYPLDKKNMSIGYRVPRVCPSCGSPAVRSEGEAVLFCSADLFNCPAQSIGTIR